MAKRYIVRLDDEERKQLAELLGRRNLAGKKRMRAQVLLKADGSPDGPAWIDSRIAEAFDVSPDFSPTENRIDRRSVVS